MRSKIISLLTIGVGTVIAIAIGCSGDEALSERQYEIECKKHYSKNPSGTWHYCEMPDEKTCWVLNGRISCN